MQWAGTFILVFSSSLSKPICARRPRRALQRLSSQIGTEMANLVSAPSWLHELVSRGATSAGYSPCTSMSCLWSVFQTPSRLRRPCENPSLILLSAVWSEIPLCLWWGVGWLFLERLPAPTRPILGSRNTFRARLTCRNSRFCTAVVPI